MVKRNVEALIITRSISLQQGLGALVESLPGITSVKGILDVSNAYGWIEIHQPAIILLDVLLSGGNTRAVLEKIRALSPETRRVILVDHVEEVGWVPRYAEGILIKGIAPSAVATILTNLLSSEGETYEHNDSNP